MSMKPAPKFSCSSCSKMFTTKYSLPVHERTHTGSKPYTCEICCKTFTTSGNLVSHRRTHTGEKPFPCNKCDTSFATTSNLATHKRIHTGEKLFVCDFCPKAFTQGSTLKVHQQRAHGTCGGNEKRFSCTFCPDASYSTRQGLNRHIRTHTGEKPYRCRAHDCRQRFYSSSELGLHRNKYHLIGVTNASVGVHICDVCQQRLSTAQILRQHKLLRHGTGLRAYSCQECGKKFKLPHQLSQHAKTHSQAKPEKCSFCPTSFKIRENLMAHIRRKHTGERSVSCLVPKCNVRFLNPSEMKAHNRRVHLREKPHACPHCDRRFTEKGNLMVHCRTHHQGHQHEKHNLPGSTDFDLSPQTYRTRKSQSTQ